MRAICLFLTCFLCSAVAAGQSAKAVDLKVSTHGCSEPADPTFSAKAASARDRAANYFADIGFFLDKQDIARKVELFCTKESARKALAAAFNVPETNIPATFSGTVQNETLFIVSPEIYKENFVGLYGADLWNVSEYERLMTHELIHSAHSLVAKRLFGTEEGMGPQWFFEGMAIEASGQLPVSEKDLNKLSINDFNEFLRAADKGDLKAPVYIQYAKYYRYARRFVSNKWLVENAGKPDFIDRLHQALQASAH